MIENTNPFLTVSHTPFETTPFHLIKTEHFEPAMEEGMKVHNQEVDAIVNSPDAPTFANTIVALEKSGALLDRVTTVFGNLLSAETNDELEEKILSFDEAAYAVKNEQFLEARGCKENGTAAKQIVEIIKKQCGLA